MGTLQVAVDVGGTFIDMVMVDQEKKRIAVSKLSTDIGVQGSSLMTAVERLAVELGSTLGQIDTMVIGTTVVTNALLEGSYARTGLITTDGFRDVLEIARATRTSAYDLRERRPTPIVPRYLRLEIEERVGYDGSVIHPLVETSVRDAAKLLRNAQVEAVAVCLLFSFANPSHEQRIGEILDHELAVPVSLSSDVLPIFREYERTSTTVINAATSVVMGRFIDSLKPLLAGGVARVYIMGSEGGCLTLPEARRYPVRCIMSGPAGGVIGGARLAASNGFDHALTLDVGGTSTDVALVRKGTLPYTDERTLGGYAIALPSVEVETVGAGGGSIAYIDPTGLLKVGPQSAGAYPGPICYDRGGARPTVTDAHVALGRLGARSMLGGEFAVNRDAAVREIDKQLGKPLGLSWIRAAQGILEVVTANIVRAVRTISVERGHDPRRLTLIAFGGAGPLHALDVARALEIPRVLIPRFPGVWSAYGILSSNIRYSTYRTWFRALHEIDLADLRSVFGELTQGLVARVTADGLNAAGLLIEKAFDVRYRGQSYTLTISAPQLDAKGVRQLTEAFHREHEARFGHAAPDDVLEIVNLRATVIYPRPTIYDAELRTRPSMAVSAVDRPVWFSETEPVTCPIYQRSQLTPGQVLDGPTIVEQYDSTIVLAPGDRLEVTPDNLNLMVNVVPSLSRRQRSVESSKERRP